MRLLLVALAGLAVVGCRLAFCPMKEDPHPVPMADSQDAKPEPKEFIAIHKGRLFSYLDTLTDAERERQRCEEAFLQPPDRGFQVVVDYNIGFYKGAVEPKIIEWLNHHAKVELSKKEQA